jgi:hypothetical protein
MASTFFDQDTVDEINRRLDAGEQLQDIARSFQMNLSTFHYKLTRGYKKKVQWVPIHSTNYAQGSAA